MKLAEQLLKELNEVKKEITVDEFKDKLTKRFKHFFPTGLLRISNIDNLLQIEIAKEPRLVSELSNDSIYHRIVINSDDNGEFKGKLFSELFEGGNVKTKDRRFIPTKYRKGTKTLDKHSESLMALFQRIHTIVEENK